MAAENESDLAVDVSVEGQRSVLSVAAACEVFSAMVPGNTRQRALLSAAEEVRSELVALAFSGLEDGSRLELAYEQMGVEFDRFRQSHPALDDSLEIWAAYLAHLAVLHVRGGFQKEELMWEQLVSYMEAVESDTGFDGLTPRFRKELETLRETLSSVGMDAASFAEFREAASEAMEAFALALREMDSIFAGSRGDGR